MATLVGDSSTYATAKGLTNSVARYVAAGYVAQFSGSATSAFVRALDWAGLTTSRIKVIVFNSLGAQIGTSDEITVPIVLGWASATFTTAVPIVSGQTYYLAVLVNSGTVDWYSDANTFLGIDCAGTYTYASPAGATFAGSTANIGNSGVYLDGTVSSAVTTGTFSWLAADAVSAVKTVTLGFEAKVIILWTSGNGSAVDNVVRPSSGIHNFGVACNKVSPTQHVIAGSQNGTSGGNQSWGTIRNDSVVVVSNADASVVGRLGTPTFNSLTVDLVVQAASPQDVQVSWLAIGGSSLSDYAVLTSAVPASIGDLDITGLGFNPVNWDSAAIVFGSRNAGGSLPLSQNGMSLSIGAANNASQAVSGANDTTARLPTGIGHDTEVFCIDDGASTDVGARASFSAWITDGLRLNFAEVSSTSVFFALVLKGLQFRIGDFTIPVGTGAFTAITGIPQPKGLMMFGTGAAKTTPGTLIAAASEPDLSIGAAHAATTGTPLNRVAQATAGSNTAGRGRAGIDYDSTIIEVKDSLGNVLGSAVDVSITSTGFTPNKTTGSTTTWAWWLAIADYIAPPPPAPTQRWMRKRYPVRPA